MLIVNYSHPLTLHQLEMIQELSGLDIGAVIEIPSQLDTDSPLGPQVEAMVDKAGLDSRTWQTEAVLLNLPSLNYSTAALLAIIHGRMGHFPSYIRLKPVAGSLPQRFDVAEIVNLQELRDKARQVR